MQTTVRTTIRIRKDLLDQSRVIALRKGTTLQEVINDMLAKGYKRITDLELAAKSVKQIDQFRQSLVTQDIKLEKLLKASRTDQK